MGIWWALQRGYKGVATIDGNNKDSIEDVLKFVEKMIEGYDFVQGSRFIKRGRSNKYSVYKMEIRENDSCSDYLAYCTFSLY